MYENILNYIGGFVFLCFASYLCRDAQCGASMVDNPLYRSSHIWISSDSEALLKSPKMEGLRLTAYKDAAGYSVGYGHYGVAKGTRISLQKAESLLQSDLQQTKRLIDRYIKNPERLTANQVDALFLFFYNLGENYTPDYNLHKMINRNPDNPEIWTQWQKYNRSQGKVLEVLERRRKAEADLYFSK